MQLFYLQLGIRVAKLQCETRFDKKTQRLALCIVKLRRTFLLDRLLIAICDCFNDIGAQFGYDK